MAKVGWHMTFCCTRLLQWNCQNIARSSWDWELQWWPTSASILAEPTTSPSHQTMFWKYWLRRKLMLLGLQNHKTSTTLWKRHVKKGQRKLDEVVNRDGKVVLVKWFDNRVVVMVSNFVGVGCVEEFLKVSRPVDVQWSNGRCWPTGSTYQSVRTAMRSTENDHLWPTPFDLA